MTAGLGEPGQGCIFQHRNRTKWAIFRATSRHLFSVLHIRTQLMKSFAIKAQVERWFSPVLRDHSLASPSSLAAEGEPGWVRGCTAVAPEVGGSGRSTQMDRITC